MHVYLYAAAHRALCRIVFQQSTNLNVIAVCCAVAVICQQLADVYVDKVLRFVASQLEASRHIDFYLTWCQRLLVIHGPKLKQRASDVMPTVRALQKNLTRRSTELGKV